MMYRQKTLQYYLALTNLNSLIGKDQNILSESGQILGLIWGLFSNVFQDITYGYGYKRLAIFRLVIIFLSINFFSALYVSYKKQGKIAKNSIEIKEKEIEDEQLTIRALTSSEKMSKIDNSESDIKINSAELSDLNIISTELDDIIQVIFDDREKNLEESEKKSKMIENKEYFRLYLKFKDGDYVKIKLGKKDFKYLIEILDTRSPSHTKIGFCKDYYPRGNWSVALRKIAKSNELDSNKSKYDPIDSYHIHEMILVKNLSFESIKPLNFVFQNVGKLIKITLTFFTNKFPSFLRVIALAILIFVVIILLVLFLCNFWQLIWVLCNFWQLIWDGISRFQAWLFIGVLGILALQVFIFWRERIEQQKDDHNEYQNRNSEAALIVQKNLENSLLFSIDILIPIIDLDQNNMDFILDAAESYFWIRTYFRTQKLLGPIIISILIPLLLL